jgi:hypothetical protein
MEHTKGELQVCPVVDSMVILKTGLDFATLWGLRKTANAKRLVLCWNSHDELLEACKKYQEMIELLYKLNPNIEIALGSGLGLKQAEDKGKAAIAAAGKG